MTLKTAIDRLASDATVAHSIVHGPAAGAGSIVETEGGPVKSFARVTAEANYNYAGDWVTATQYYLKDVVLQDGLAYASLTAHVSAADFATDLAAGRWTIHQGATVEQLDAAVDELLPGAIKNYLCQFHKGL